MTDVAPVSVSRRIPARPREIFAILADPNRHLEIDGSGMLRRRDRPGSRLRRGRRVRDEDVPRGVRRLRDEQHRRRVPAGRLIGWEPARRDIDAEPWHYRWRYELVPEEDGATVVTESFDLSHSPEEARQATKDGTVWTEAMNRVS